MGILLEQYSWRLVLGRLCLVECVEFHNCYTIPVINKTHDDLLAIIKDKRSEIVLEPPADQKSILCFTSFIIYMIN